MPCETRKRAGQSIQQRATEVREAVSALEGALARRKAKVVVGPQGAVTFTGWENRNDVTDACAYRRIMATGSALARMEIAKAEKLAGRVVDRKVIVQGVHSHDGGSTWGSD